MSKLVIEIDGEKKEITLKPIKHKERKEWLKKVNEIIKMEDDAKATEQLTVFREEFVKRHIVEDIDLDELPAKEVDKIFQAIEGEMDFHMGLRRLIQLNTVPLKEQQSTQLQGNST